MKPIEAEVTGQQGKSIAATDWWDIYTGDKYGWCLYIRFSKKERAEHVLSTMNRIARIVHISLPALKG